MTLANFVEKYNLHDSYFNSIEYDTENQRLDMELAFSFWLQKNFIEGSAEDGVLKLSFTGVTLYDCPDGDPCGDFVGILSASLQNEAMIIALMDDEENHYFELKLMADDVQVKEIHA